MANKWILIGLALFSLLGTAGCSVETAHAPEAELVATATPSPTATFAPNTAVIFKRSGGVLGLEESWVIFADGPVESNTTIEPSLSAEDVNYLLDNLDSVGFFDLGGSYLPEDTCCDRFFYEITAVQDTTFHTVTTLEATPDMPEALQQAIKLIETALFAESEQ
ncbi:MAG: hypothetical protein KC445_14205 [Anaerolineales bacterium]|nr:hypothetical protein [Anaerolineales bacterium]